MDADPGGIQEGLRGVFTFLARMGGAHGVDGSRLDVVAALAKPSGATELLLGDSTAPPGVKAAVLYY